MHTHLSLDFLQGVLAVCLQFLLRLSKTKLSSIKAEISVVVVSIQTNFMYKQNGKDRESGRLVCYTYSWLKIKLVVVVRKCCIEKKGMNFDK